MMMMMMMMMTAVRQVQGRLLPIGAMPANTVVVV
jgi:hypothetical protein